MFGLRKWHYGWMLAVSRAWSEEGFTAKLKKAPRTYIPHADLLPDYVALSVMEADAEEWKWHGRFWTLPYTQVIIRIPNKPADSQMSMALAVYAERISYLIPPQIPMHQENGKGRGHAAATGIGNGHANGNGNGHTNGNGPVTGNGHTNGNGNGNGHVNGNGNGDGNGNGNGNGHANGNGPVTAIGNGGVMFGSGIGGGVYGGGLGGGGSMSPAESPLAAFDQMIRWFHVWPQAVARAWSDPQFEQHLIQETHLALHNAFGYQVPGGVLLKAERADPAHQWVATDTDPCMPGEWVSLPDIDLTMILPPKPKNESEGPVALGAYAETGRTYPFTMCCC